MATRKKPTDLTTQILVQIRDRLDATVQRLDATNERLEQLAKAQVHAETRVATELVTVAGTLQALRAEIRELGQSRRLEEVERRLAAVEAKFQAG